MSLKLSTGLRNRMLDTSPLRTIFALGFLEVYAGGVPAQADDTVLGATLLCRYSNDNTTTGLTFAAVAVNGEITKNLAETWRKAAVGSGTATFWRFVAPGDTGTLSTTEPRIQGTVGLAGADMNLANLSYVATTVYTLDEFAIGIPER